MIADLFAADTLTAAADAVRNPRPPKPPAPKGSSWSDVYRLATGAVEAGAQVLASTAEVVGGAAQVLGAYPEMFGPLPMTPAQRKGADDSRDKLLRDGVDMNNEVGDALRSAGQSYRPDPQTASTAETLIHGFARGATKIIGGAVAGGAPGIFAASAEEANTAAEDLRQQGVPFEARAKAGAVQGGGMALAALPLVGQTLPQTAALFLAGGPGGFMAQQALTREILRDAGQDKVAEQYDPFDPVGLAMSTLIPGGFTAYAVRGQRAARRAAGPTQQQAAQVAAPAMPPEVVDAAMVSNLVQRNDSQRAPMDEVTAARILDLQPAPDAAAPALKPAASEELAVAPEAAAPRIEPEAQPPMDLAAQERELVDLRKRDAVLTKLLECMQ